MTISVLMYFGFLFVLGAVLGSFGGVIIERGKDGFSRDSWGEVFGGRSYCPGCKGKLLTWWQLIPLLGWLLQKGKCFRCQQSIPAWYCRIELIMGLVFVACGWMFLAGSPGGLLGIAQDPLIMIMLGLWLLINWSLVNIIIADLWYYELNMYQFIILIGTSLLYGGVYGWSFVIRGIIGILIMVGVFGILYYSAKWYASRKFGEGATGLGEGDVIMAFGIGLLAQFVVDTLDSFSWIEGVQLVFLYLIISSALGICYRILRRMYSGEENPHLPFLPGMIGAFWILLFYANEILVLLA